MGVGIYFSELLLAKMQTNQWSSGSQLVVILPPVDMWQFVETFLVVNIECYLHLRGEEARVAAKHPTIYNVQCCSSCCNKHYLAQNANSAEVEKPQVRGICTHYLQTEKVPRSQRWF